MSLPTTTHQYFFPELGSYNNLVLHEVPLAAPKPNEVTVKTHAVSLQYRDLWISRGTYPGFIAPNLVPCSDMAGEVVAVGADVTQWKVGDRVSANFMPDKLYEEQTLEIKASALGGASQGVLTQYRGFPAHSLVAIPAHLSYEEAATLPCAAVTAYNALTGGYTPIKAGDTILVLGTGGVSIFALQFAVTSGAAVIALSSSDEKLKAVTKLGARHVVNYRTTPKWEEEGVDRVIEVVGNATLPHSIASVKIDGSIDIIGGLGDAEEHAPPVDIIRPCINKGLKIRGIHVGSVKQFKEMNRLMVANAEETRPVIDRVFAFEEAKEAYKYLESQAHVGKVVIKL
ncbi:alcohol dehydrogenase superfamily protein [Mycena latifolia]|nr:alcohol dehydrogenase superfamily protein [Mycena latifolia]